MVFPAEDQIKNFPGHKRVKLSSVVYKLNSDKAPLMGIQFKFSGEVESPMFQTANAVQINKVSEKEIQFEKRIAKVRAYLSTSLKIYALQLEDDSGELALDLQFETGPGSWHTREIPADREIIGLSCNTQIDSHYIKDLAIVTWIPNL